MIETRAVEIRLADDETRNGPGVLHGVLLPYEQRASDRAEMFGTGSLAWPADGIMLREMHNRSKRRLSASYRTTVGAEVRVAIALPDTQRGRDAATGVRNGTYRGLSVEFQAKHETRRAGLRYVTAAQLVGAGLVDDPSYAGATIEVRQADLRRRFPIWLL